MPSYAVRHLHPRQSVATHNRRRVRRARLVWFVACAAMLLMLLGLGSFSPASSPPLVQAAAKSYPVQPYVYAASTSATTYDIMLADGANKDRMVAQVKVDSIYFGDVAARLAYDKGMLAFRVSGDRNGGSSLYVVDISTGAPTQLALSKTKAEGIGAFAWSPAGRTLAYVRSSPGVDPADADLAYGTVYLYSAGFKPVKLGGSNGNDRVLAFSGDGLGVYVVRREAARTGTLEHLAFLPLSGGEATVIMRSQPGLKYSSYAVWTLPNQPAKIAALAEGDFTLALVGTVPAKPTATATPTVTVPPQSTITSTFQMAASATLVATTPTTTTTPTRMAPLSKVPVAGKLARPSGLGIVVADPASAVPYLVRRDAEAFPDISWAVDGKSLMLGGSRSGAAWVVDLEGGRWALGTPLRGLSVLSWSADGSVAMLSDSPTSKLLTLDFRGGKVLASRALGFSKVAAPAVSLAVPYIHQVNDTAASGDGNWACGPTSVAMALAYYGKLEPWETVMQGRTGAAAAPSGSRPPAGMDFAPYVTNVYTYNGRTYSATARDPRGNMLAGLYGTICPTGLASWSAMRSVLEWHGLTGNQIAASWDGVVGALKKGRPVLLGNMLTSEGHILLAIGYTQDGNLIVNDPYGNRFEPGYGANNGERVIYPWKRTTARTAVEVIGVWPPPTRTPTPTATSTVTPTSTATATATNTPTPVVTFIAIPDAQATEAALQQGVPEATPEPIFEPTPEPVIEPAPLVPTP
ncbi:MAG: C39 family peptidase [Chloroflexota bacterium]|nr:C39 family peptidase [Chloroflexota bacterium]MDQ5866939.1 C39 family peptidase [Chloroflexota bacterium]